MLKEKKGSRKLSSIQSGASVVEETAAAESTELPNSFNGDVANIASISG